MGIRAAVIAKILQLGRDVIGLLAVQAREGADVLSPFGP